MLRDGIDDCRYRFGGSRVSFLCSDFGALAVSATAEILSYSNWSISICMRKKVRILVSLIAITGPYACGGPRSLVWQEEDGFRWAELSVPRSGRDGFAQLPASRTGVTFTNSILEEQAMQNEHLYNGSGLALGDMDGDGLTDIYFSRLDGPNVLYRNLGDWRFEDVTEQAGVAAPGRFSTGAVFADVDGDRDLDLLVTSMEGANAFFENNGDGTFTERTEEAGLSSHYYGTTQALADVDGDGDLDLYVANNKVKPARDVFPPSELGFDNVVEEIDGQHVVRPQFRDHYKVVMQPGRVMRFEYAEPDKFYLNDGTGRFEEVSFTSGRFLDEDGRPLQETPTDWGLTARFHDFDDDGDPDLYVCNDFESPDRFWVNDGTGRFQLIERLALRATSNATMTMDYSDIDRDGSEDFILIDMLDRNTRQRKTQVQSMEPAPTMLGQIDDRPQIGRNTLFWNRGDNTFSEIAHFAGVEASGWSWSVLFLDVDLDGYEDILIGNGHQYDFLDSDSKPRIRATGDTLNWRRWRLLLPELKLPNVAFHNKGDLTFEETAKEWGFADQNDISHGAATADLDLDGDLDIVINKLTFPAGLYRNESSRNRIAVRLRGETPNTQGIGSKIRVIGGPVPEQQKEVTSGGTYVSGSDPTYSFAAGDAARLTIVVDWRSGKKSVIEGAVANRMYEVYESGAVDASEVADSLRRRRKATAPAQEFFSDVSAMITHEHVDTEYDDFVRQPLIRHRMSQTGPGVSWSDVDRDGDDDLLVSSGRGGTLAFYRNTNGELSRAPLQTGPAPLDQTAVLELPDGRGGTALLVGQANYEAVNPSQALAASSVLKLDLGSPAALMEGGGFVEAVPGIASTTGPLALSDYDGDGDLDLFVGGRVLPARYPQHATSRLFLNSGGSFQLDEANATLLEDIGMVSSAVFTDIDSDGDPDLLLAMDWGPLRLLSNDEGNFKDVTDQWGLATRTSMWNGVTVGDFNGDGLLDVVATSWGANTRLRADPTHPLRSYYGDFDANGTMDILEARYDERLGDLTPVRGRQTVIDAISFVRRRIPTFAAYADANVEGVIGPAMQNASYLDVNTFAHTLLLNQSDSFEIHELPMEAQLSPSFSVGVADFDGDGNEDLFLTQNFYPTEPLMPRYAAGRGQWLRGDGSGRFEAVSAIASGVKVYGDQRAAALSDYDRDGRVDLAVSQNGNTTKLYRNVLAKRGIRVRLIGDRENPDAVGATMRLVYGNTMGPAREIHAGDGYLSQNSMVQVMGIAGEVTAVWVRWPDGSESTTPVGSAVSEVAVRMPGS